MWRLALTVAIATAVAAEPTRPALKPRAPHPLERPRPLTAIHGGLSPPAPLALLAATLRSRTQREIFMQYATCAGIVAAWLTLAASVFALSEGWTPAQAFFYAVDTGMSIGFGAVSERRLITKLFTIGHVLLGASCVGGAIALFAESAVNASPAIAAAQYSIASVNSAFSRADADGSGAISPLEFSGMTRPSERAPALKEAARGAAPRPLPSQPPSLPSASTSTKSAKPRRAPLLNILNDFFII